MKITPEFIDDLKFRNRIEDVISTYVTLKRAGSRLVGLCPFHSEKTPSFTVFTDTNSYHCFGCGAGGDVITFVMAAENLDYLGAREFLCNRVGMKMPDTDGEKSESGRRRRFYDMNREAARFFHASLSKPGAEGAVDYLINRRKLPKSAITRFGIGYAPDSFDALRKHMISLGYRDEELKEAFLCGKSKTGKYFDYFRGRIMFPIIDNFGNVIAFGGRAIGDKEPKYLNSSDTPVFKKSRNLYSLNFARTCCSEELILCEGYMDVIAVNQAGFENVVATLGTAITPNQARLISHYCDEVVIAYDSDGAGQNATQKAINHFSDVGLRTRILHMDGAKDPDEYIKKFGAQRFRNLIEGSDDANNFMLDRCEEGLDLDSESGKVELLKRVSRVLAGIESPLEREVYISRTAKKCDISAEVLKSHINEMIRIKKAGKKKEEWRNIKAKAAYVRDDVNPEAVQFRREAKAEETIISYLLRRPEDAEKIGAAAPPEIFVTAFNKRVYSALLRAIRESEHFTLSLIADEFTPQEMGRISGIVAANREFGITEKAMLDCAESLRQHRSPAGTDGNISDDDLRDLFSKKRH